MDNNSFSKKTLTFGVVLSILIVLVIYFQQISYRKNRVVFCDVGQGDGVYIRTSENIDIVIDAGPNSSILQCLGRYMPFYDRNIELAFLTHPQHDHYGGYLSILGRYKIDYFIAPPVDNPNQSFNRLKSMIKEKQSAVKNFYSGENINIGRKTTIDFLWPDRELIAGKNNNVGQNVLGAFTTESDLNEFSQVFLFSEGDFDILFTGDITPEVLDSLVNQGIVDDFGNLEVLKVPHHGSKNGLTLQFIHKVNPQLSVISVAKKNRYGHPSRQILDMFKTQSKKYLTTAEQGDIVIEVDSSGWKVAD